MPPIDLKVPYQEKDDAKRLGARWDAARKTWYLPDGSNTEPFAKWLTSQSDIDIRCSSYFVAQSTRKCWRCDQSTQVFGFLLPRGHEVWLDSDDFVGWEQQTSAAVVYYTTYLPSPVQAQMRSLSDQYRNDFSRTTQTYYWMNHCDHCGMKQGDFELFEEFDTPFCPADVRDACRILLHPVHEPFEASATSIAYEPGFFERMRVLPSR
jgi:hypothetical protein